MTDPQRRALAYLAAHGIVTPADLGQGMGGTRRGVAQGLGRLGGAMGARLVKLGLASKRYPEKGVPGYSITPAGRQTLAAAEPPPPRPDQP